MIRRLIAGRISAAERFLGVPADYMRYMLRVSLRAFLKFAKFASLSQYRRALPAAAYHVARIVGTRAQDCGPCVQIVINLAKHDRVPAPLLAAALESRPADLPDDLADVFRFTDEVLRMTGEEGPYRERIRGRYGDEALVELAMAIAFCQVFPVTKRGLGFAQSCSVTPVHV